MSDYYQRHEIPDDLLQFFEETIPPATQAVVLDPFCGSGTTLMVARQLGRIGLGFDLSEKYLYENCRVRLGHDKLAAWGKGINGGGSFAGLPLFAEVQP